MRGERRRAQLEADHHATTAPNRWTCRLEGCPVAGIWHPVEDRAQGLADAAAHYLARHYSPEAPYTLRGLATATA